MLKIQDFTRENIERFSLQDTFDGIRFRDVEGRFMILQESLRLRPDGSSVVCYLIHHYSGRAIELGRHEWTDSFPILVAARAALLRRLETHAKFACDMGECTPAEEHVDAYCDAYEAQYETGR